MANAIIQPSRALTVNKSDNANIPYPAIARSGTTTGAGLNQLIDAGANFPALQIYPGNIVYNTATGASATITDVSPATPTILTLNANIFAGAQAYIIYQSSPMAGGQNTGCVLYIGTGGDVKVTTAGNDIVTFVGIQNGSFLPVQVLKVWNIGLSANIIALW